MINEFKIKDILKAVNSISKNDLGIKDILNAVNSISKINKKNIKNEEKKDYTYEKNVLNPNKQEKSNKS